MLLCPVHYMTQQILNILFYRNSSNVLPGKSKVALVEFLCLIFSQRGALVLTLPLCMNMWNQQFSLIREMFRVLPPKRLSEKFRNFTNGLC